MLRPFSNVDGPQPSRNLGMSGFAFSWLCVVLDRLVQTASFHKKLSLSRRAKKNHTSSSPAVPLPPPHHTHTTGLMSVNPWLAGNSGYSHWMPPFRVLLVQSLRELELGMWWLMEEKKAKQRRANETILNLEDGRNKFHLCIKYDLSPWPSVLLWNLKNHKHFILSFRRPLLLSTCVFWAGQQVRLLT